MRKFTSSRKFIGNAKRENYEGVISMTVPDLAPSMRELLVRHANGIVDNVQQNLSFSGDMPDLRGIEPHELAQLTTQNNAKLKELHELANGYALQMREEQYRMKRENDIKLLKELETRKEE